MKRALATIIVAAGALAAGTSCGNGGASAGGELHDAATMDAGSETDVCVPNCEGKQCGDDGCGGECLDLCYHGCHSEECEDGVCVSGESACAPNCWYKECGDDGCGCPCGECAEAETCVDGECVCKPACDGKHCGDDGCGGDCGKCAKGHACFEGVCACVPDCQARECGPDGCGGNCGECGPGSAWCSGYGICVPPGWALIPPGSFVMGSPDSEACSEADEHPQHEVVVSRPLLVDALEVTQGMWKTRTGTDPSYHGPNGPVGSCCAPGCPVESVNWYEAVTFANELSLSAGLPTCYVTAGCEGQLGGGCPGPAADHSCPGDYTCAAVTFVGLSCAGYRLPTEAEWEYLARAGGTKALPHPGPDGSDVTAACSGCDQEAVMDDYEWYCFNSGASGTQPGLIGQANAWDLYDVAGNVSEWVWDQYQSDYYLQGEQTDPLGGSGTLRIIRGGNHASGVALMRSASRVAEPPEKRASTVGFRLVRSVLSTTCAPDCEGKQCGKDGCGGNCGECPADHGCNQDGLCCLPDCEGRECGWDGCDGFCGFCPEDCWCDDSVGFCMFCSCVPECTGKQCGHDGCGGFCGTCSGDSVCNWSTGICEEVCLPQCMTPPDFKWPMQCGPNSCPQGCMDKGLKPCKKEHDCDPGTHCNAMTGMCVACGECPGCPLGYTCDVSLEDDPAVYVCL